MDLFYNLIIANLFHGLVCVIWISGVKRAVRGLPADLYSELLRFALIVPVVLGFLRLVGLPLFPSSPLIRVEEWAAALLGANVLVRGAFFLFLGGIALIFLGQELFPTVAMLRRKSGAEQSEAEPGPRLQRAVERVNRLYDEARVAPLSGVRLELGARLPVGIPLAALRGLVRPVVVVSDGLLKRLDDEELEGVLAHERAHLHYGGNMRMFLAWIARAIQAFNPFALVLFRELIEARELACDALAARATGKPGILARALLKFQEPSDSVDTGFLAHGQKAGMLLKQARQELRDRAESEATKNRLDALGAGSLSDPITPRVVVWAQGLFLGGILWMIS